MSLVRTSFLARDVFEVMITTTLEVRKAVLGSYNKLHKIVLQLVLDDPLCQRFMMVPGIGAIVALSFEVVRFTRSRIVSAHSGLTQRRHQSGTSIDFAAHVTKMDDINARGVLCEAATSPLLRSKRWSAVKAWVCGSPGSPA